MGRVSITSTIMSTSKSQNSPRRIDMHCHMVGNGVAGSGGWLRLGGWHRLLAGFMIKQLGFPAAVLEGDLEGVYSRHLLDLVRSSSLDAVVLLAHERVHDADGTPRDDLGSMYVPNEVVLDLAAAHPEFLAGVSIHPARPDAIAELERCLERGAVLMKCLPNCQNINPSDVRYRSFWERMAEARLPLLAHTGGEHTVPEVNPAWADPKLLRLPLACGVTVIAAHCATRSGPRDTDYFGDWTDMLLEFPNLYGDISAMVSL
ncbi:MAG: amidohydrolase family protein, partial [Chthoniobacterales bacterium]